MLDTFAPNAFSLQSLTAAINNTVYVPGQISASGLFDEAGISTLTANVESRDGVLELVDPVARNSAPNPLQKEGDRRIVPFVVPHMPQRDTLMADEVQGVRAFGSEDMAEPIIARLNDKIQRMRRNIDYTMEYHRLAAVMGNYIASDGTSTSLFTTFGVTQQTLSMAFNASSSSSARTKATTIHEYIESALDGVPYSGIRVWCSSGFWKALLEDKDAKETYLNWQAAADLRQDPTESFTWQGITWERYRGNSTVAVTADAAYAVPTGVPDLCLTRFAPANYVETVNTIGLPYYAKSKVLDFDKGFQLEAQSNALNICTRPRAIIKLTKS
jgi:hypothetical protein